uniref:Polyprotein n=1 Tax=Angiostrongylus cantonensis TaxID=6313 RepID=A0A0K0D7X1_ANGCA
LQYIWNSFNFQYPTAKGKRYTDALGRSLYAFVLSLKHHNVTECLRNLRPDIILTRTYRIECDSSGNFCVGMLAVSNEAKAIYIVFRDTTTKKQLATEFLNGLGAQFGAWEKFESTDAGVISYFHHAFYKVFIDTGMKDEFLHGLI